MGNYYTSRFHVTVSPDMIGEGIECVSDNGTVMVWDPQQLQQQYMYNATDLVLIIIIMITFRLISINFSSLSTTRRIIHHSS